MNTINLARVGRLIALRHSWPFGRAVAAVCAGLALCAAAQARVYRAGDVRVVHPYATPSQSFPMTMEFERGGKVEAKVVVQVPKVRAEERPDHKH